MNNTMRVIFYFGVSIIFIGVIMWRFQVLEVENNREYATFPSYYKDNGMPVETLELKPKTLFLYKKISVTKNNNNQLIAKVNKADQTYFKKGQKVFFTQSDKVIGEVSFVSKKINFQDGLYTILIDSIDFDFQNHKNLIPVRIQYKAIDNILKLPVKALVPKDHKYYTWVLEDEKTYRREVKIRNHNQKYVEVISGLQSGDIVMTNGHRTILTTDKINQINK